MTRIRTAAALSAITLVGVTLLAGCSSTSDTATTETTAAAAESSAPAESASAAPSGSTQMLPPIIITETDTSATCVVGNYLDIVIPEDKLAGTTVASSDEAIVTVTQAKQEGDALFNPGGQCIAAGEAVITVTNPDNTTRDIALTVTP